MNCIQCGKSIETKSRRKDKKFCCKSCMMTYRHRVFPKDKYDLPVEFFREWSPNMAYIVGFIVADGCIGLDKRNNTLCLSINSTDRDVLDKIASVLGKWEVKSVQQKRVSKVTGNLLKINHYLYTSNRRFIAPLFDIGLCLNKTYKMGELSIPNEYFWDFLRGFTDGDGSLTNGISLGKKYAKIAWTGGSELFMKWLHREVCDRIGKVVKLSKRKNSGVYYFSLSGESLKKVIISMYENPVIFMDRKMRIASRWIDCNFCISGSFTCCFEGEVK